MLLFCTILLLASLACRFSATPEVEPVETVVEPVETPPPAEFTPQVTQVGDPAVNDADVEF